MQKFKKKMNKIIVHNILSDICLSGVLQYLFFRSCLFDFCSFFLKEISRPLHNPLPNTEMVITKEIITHM